MSFLQELGKGFIRSAVNQVGRDGGKVISNKIYGDAHATPIRRVGQSTSGTYFDTETNQPIDANTFRDMLIQYGYKPQLSVSGYGIFMRIYAFFFGVLATTLLLHLSPIFSFIPALVILIMIICKIAGCKQIKLYKNEVIPIYTQDKRYKTGQKLKGYTESKNEYLAISTPKERKFIILSSLLYLPLPALMFYFGIKLDGITGRTEYTTELYLCAISIAWIIISWLFTKYNPSSKK